MKKLQIAAAALAVMMVVGSAFTTPKTNFSFKRVSGDIRSEEPSDYEYRPSNGCNVSSTTTCSALWDESSTPVVGAHPQGTFQSIASDGVYIP